MKIYRHIGDGGPSLSGSVVTLGNFDGIHLGHQALLLRVVQEAKRLGGASVVLTFEPHPLKVLAPQRAPRLLLSTKDKLRLFQSLGVDVVVIQHFDAKFAGIEARDFACNFLARQLGAKKIWVGRDLRFGKGRKGSIDDLAGWGEAAGFDVGIVDPVLLDGSRVSSSRIRQLIENGSVDEARPMLGRYHFLSGRVVAGHRRGRELGFPTANIFSRTEVLPPDGIYATLFEVKGSEWRSVTNIGINPTFGGGPRTVESFILDANRDIYGAAVKVSFVKRLRDEMKFASAEQLVAQMHRDVEATRSVFKQLELASPSSLAR